MDAHMVTWWCSFVDPDRPAGSRFLGVVLARMPEGTTLPLVSAVLHGLGLNPGGEMLAYRWSWFPVPDNWVGRLLTKDEAGAADRWMANQYPEAIQPTPDELRSWGTVAGEGEQ